MERILNERITNGAGVSYQHEIWDCAGMTIRDVANELRLSGYDEFWYDEAERCLIAESPSGQATEVKFSKAGVALKPDMMEAIV